MGFVSLNFITQSRNGLLSLCLCASGGLVVVVNFSELRLRRLLLILSQNSVLLVKC